MIQLYLGDCLDILPSLSGINALISDPPYGEEYSPRQITTNSKAWGLKTFTGNIVVSGDDIPFDPSPFLNYPVVILFGGNHYADKLPPSPGWIIWDKRDGLTSNDFADCELIWTNQNRVARLFRHRWMGALRDSEKGIPRVHPTQKPIVLMEWIINNYTQPGDTILDPFSGSGTTGIAAYLTGRNCILIEKDPEIYKVMELRISKIQQQPFLSGIESEDLE